MSLNRPLVISLGVLIGLFSPWLYNLWLFARADNLFSHILIVPAVTAYLVWAQGFRPGSSKPDFKMAGAILTIGGAVGLWYWWGENAATPPRDQLVFQGLIFVILLWGICALFLRRDSLRGAFFPLAFLVFMVPWPTSWVDGLESFLQHRSAEAAAWMFKLAGTPFFRDETYFALPGINLQVAPECSGIRSSVALFITSCVASYLFLRSTVTRLLLVAVVLPLAILRNGFRVFVIGELCVHVRPEMIDSYIHHHGGPIFFALSLVPFSLCLWLLLKWDRSLKISSPKQMAT